MRIDLNSDLGEGAGYDDEILSLVSSANIACGFHAGTPASIFESLCAAKRHGVSVGAHPSFDDRPNFGRNELQMPPADLSSLVTYQLGAFQALCRSADVKMNHVKPHGAVYNMAARDHPMAVVIAKAVVSFDAHLFLFAPPSSALEQAASELNLSVIPEVFADRNYNADGSLVSRAHPAALLHDPLQAAKRVIRMLREKKVRTLEGSDISISAATVCVHGDTPGAVDFVRALRARLEAEEITIAAPDQTR